MSTKITTDQVKKMAQLCNLNLTDSELEKFSEYFTDTMTHIDVLNELDTSDVTETFQVTGLKNVFMQGESNKATLSKEDALMNAQTVVKGLFATKPVFDR
jgi:aspartyl/glutamyl-tRNA(Asn/Gln) amidotransferase C subunit